jgi:hypothetical protein
MTDTAHEQETNVLLGITNLVLAVLALTIAGVFIYGELFYKPEIDPKQTAKYLSEARERLEQHSDEISAEAAALAEEALPPIGNAIYAQAKEDYPLYIRTLKTEGRTYLDHAEKILVKRVKARYGEYLREHRDVIKEEFPNHASDENVERVLRDFERTADRILERYYVDEFRREADRTVALWERVRPLDMPAPDEPSLEEQLADYAADWTVLAVADRTEDAANDR